MVFLCWPSWSCINPLLMLTLWSIQFSLFFRYKLKLLTFQHSCLNNLHFPEISSVFSAQYSRCVLIFIQRKQRGVNNKTMKQICFAGCLFDGFVFWGRPALMTSSLCAPHVTPLYKVLPVCASLRKENGGSRTLLSGVAEVCFDPDPASALCGGWSGTRRGCR